MINEENVIKMLSALLLFSSGALFGKEYWKTQQIKQPHVTITVPVKAQKILEGLAERGVDEVGITIDLDEKL